MKEITVTGREAGQRADKLLARYLNDAPRSFLYRMMRKKNITLNGKKMQGNEVLKEGDVLKLFLADETVEKFQKEVPSASFMTGSQSMPLEILYEDEHILLLNKPAGILSQKAHPQDISAVEYLTAYLIDSGSMTPEQLRQFHPSVCNRLDRNTSGILTAGKTLTGLQELSRLLHDRSLHKYYCCIVKGRMSGGMHLKGYLKKDTRSNQVAVSRTWSKDALPIETEYRTLAAREEFSLLEVLLITGRSHQIRAHLASIGHPILGDPRYGDLRLNQRYQKECGKEGQLLHAWRLEFPQMEGPLAALSEARFTAPAPEPFSRFFPEYFS